MAASLRRDRDRRRAQRPGRRRLPRQGGQEGASSLERRDVAGGILANSELAPGVRSPSGSCTRSAACATSVVKDLKLGAARPRADRARGPRVRAAARRWRHHVLRRRGHDRRGPACDQRGRRGRRYVAFDQKVRALSSFLAHVNAAIPPDIKSPSVADAIAGLKLGRAFKGLGAKPGREVTRAMPMAIADFVREGLEHDAVVAGPSRSRAILFTAMGVVVGRHGVRVPERLRRQRRRRDRADARTRRAAPARSPRRWLDPPQAVRRRDPHRRRGRRRSSRTTTAAPSGVRAGGRRRRCEARAVVSAADPKRTLTRLVDPVVLGPHLVWRAGQHPDARHDGEGEPRAVGRRRRSPGRTRPSSCAAAS